MRIAFLSWLLYDHLMPRLGAAPVTNGLYSRLVSCLRLCCPLGSARARCLKGFTNSKSPLPAPRSPLPAPRSPLPAPRSPLPAPRSPLPAPRSLDLLLIPSALGLPFFSTGTITPLRPSPFHCTFYALCYELYGESCSHQCTFIAVGYRLGSNIRWNHRFLGR